MSATLTLHSLFANNAVLQRDVPLPVFGRGVPGQLVKVALGKKTISTRVDARGFWRGEFEPMPAGGPYVLAVSFASQQLIRRGIMIGDVWVATGGDGVGRSLTTHGGGQTLPLKPGDGRVRVFSMDGASSPKPKADCMGGWVEPTSETAGKVSAVAYHFGTTLQGALDCVVGGIQATLPGADAKAWQNPESETANPESFGAAYNGVIAPLSLFPVRGVIWWPDIEPMLAAPPSGSDVLKVILGWRKAWRRDQLPFFMVQAGGLPGLESRSVPVLREAQLAGLQLGATGLVVAADVSTDPRDADSAGRTIAERLALCALGVAHGRSVPNTGPVFARSSVLGGSVRIEFSNVSGSLRSRGLSGLEGFEIAGLDRQFVPARARIDSESVVVDAASVPEPLAVRYGWCSAPKLTLENNAGLPASPFRTDDWPLND